MNGEQPDRKSNDLAFYRSPNLEARRISKRVLELSSKENGYDSRDERFAATIDSRAKYMPRTWV